MAKTATKTTENKSAKQVLEDAKAHISERAKNIEALRTQLDDVSGAIAQAIINGDDVTDLSEQQIALQAEISRLEMVLDKLRESLPELERQVVFEHLHQTLADVRDKRRQRQSLLAEIEPLRAKLEPLEKEAGQIGDLLVSLSGHVNHWQQELVRKHDVELDIIKGIIADYED